MGHKEMTSTHESAGWKADIALAKDQFRDLWREHWRGGNGLPRGVYHKLTAAKEALLVALAERIARLERFASCMAAKELLERDCS
jgi:hypothetical protein